MALGPGGTFGPTACAGCAPFGEDVIRDFERRVVPAELGAGGGDLVIAERRAMGRGRALLVR